MFNFSNNSNTSVACHFSSIAFHLWFFSVFSSIFFFLSPLYTYTRYIFPTFIICLPGIWAGEPEGNKQSNDVIVMCSHVTVINITELEEELPPMTQNHSCHPAAEVVKAINYSTLLQLGYSCSLGLEIFVLLLVQKCCWSLLFIYSAVTLSLLGFAAHPTPSFSVQLWERGRWAAAGPPQPWGRQPWEHHQRFHHQGNATSFHI